MAELERRLDGDLDTGLTPPRAGNEAIKALQAEVATLSQALEASDEAYDKANRQVRELQRALAELKEQRAIPNFGVADVVDRLQHEKQQLEKDGERQQDEIRELRKRIEEYAAKMAAAADETERQLEAVRAELREALLRHSAESAENDALRKEHEGLQSSLESKLADLSEAEKAKQQLIEALEGSKTEIARLKRVLDIAREEADEAQFKRQEELDARQQLEQNLFQTRQELDHLKVKQFSESRPLELREDAYPPANRSGAGMAKGWRAALAGALLAFTGAEALSILAGNGEILTALLDQEQTQKPTLAINIDTAPDPSDSAPQTVSNADLAAANGGPMREQQPVERRPLPSNASIAETGTIIRDRLADGSLGPAMVYVRGTRFRMGRDHDQLVPDERPAHSVDLRDFAIATTEVTFAEFNRFARATNRPVPDDMEWGRGQRPVINVSWNAASAYARWLSIQTGKQYRLPTEAEWEFAAAGGGEGFYWWGYELEQGRANCFDCGVEWSGNSTAPVASLAANPYGLFDPLGNVMEWVEDCYHSSYEGAPDNGTAWVEPGCTWRVARGGAFNKPGESLRLTKRSRFRADEGLFMLGFRLVREVR